MARANSLSSDEARAEGALRGSEVGSRMRPIPMHLNPPGIFGVREIALSPCHAQPSYSGGGSSGGGEGGGGSGSVSTG